MPQLAKNWTGHTLIDGPGKVEVRVRNGYLSTGFPSVNQALPDFLRCYEVTEGGKSVRKWVSGLSEKHVPELDGVFPNQVVQQYHQKARAERHAAATAKEIPTTARQSGFASQYCPTRPASTLLSARA